MPEPNSKTFERLPKCVVPKHYNICLQPDLQEFTFTGECTVQVEVTSPEEKVLLNALDLKISEAQFTDVAGNTQKSKSIDLVTEDELAVIVFETPLLVGQGELQMKFEGKLNDLLKGFYRSKYFTSEGEQRYCACTHFESTDARRAFPCWDEPALKATFDIALVVPKDRLALSNMNVLSDEVIGAKGELRKVKFARSPVMSTYLVAFVVGEFDHVEDVSTDGIQVRVYTPVGKKEQGKFALQVATKSLPYFKDYFGIAYPLPKMDLIALADFAFGAMENWGLVTYRETCLLLDPENTSTLRKQQIASTVAHELAHQWFGNLVTMEWWTHLWLNEGFATFMQFLCVHFLFPEFDIWTQFISSTFSSALELDALNNSHPVEVPVSHPHEIDEIFDDISYKKGASVIRMLNKFLSDEVFRKGLHGYLKKHAYANCSTEHLWEALEESSGKPVASVMSTWTQQKGFPFITVSCKSDGNNRILTLTQEKFHVGTNGNSLWVVPVSISASGCIEKPIKQFLLESHSTEVVLENLPKDQLIIVNPGAVGFYRVMYSEDMMSQLVPAILDQSLPPIDRLTIQNDLFAMVQAGKASSLEILKLLEVYEKETNYTVWTSISNCLVKLNLLLSHLDFQDLFYSYCRQLFATIHSKLGWDPIKGESHSDVLLRGLVISWSALAQDEAVLAEAKRRFEAHASNISTLPADLRNVVYKSAASQGDSKTFDTLLRLYREADLQEEKNRLSMALGSFRNKEYIQKVLDFSLSSEVRSQDAVFVISSVARTKPGRDMAWNFFQAKKDELLAKYQSSYLLSWLIKEVLENFASEEKAQEIETFFMKNHFPGSNRSVQQALETIRLQAKWLDRDQDVIKTYLTSRQ